MKSFILLVLLGITAVTLGRPEDTYNDKWDDINVDEILESERLLKGYVDCLLNKGRCTSDGQALKETLPDALEHECQKCTEKQKTAADKVVRYLVNKRPDLWKLLSGIYDPNNIFQEKYKTRIDGLKNNNIG